jgi:hypothetical protein
MRISTKVRNALIGVVGAAALTGGALAAAAAPASAATASPAPASAAAWHGCYGYGCIGKYPEPQGCSSDASTVYALSVYDGLRHTRVTLRLRYSPGCQSEWATVTDSGRPDGAIFWIYDRDDRARDVHQAVADDQDGRCREDQGAGVHRGAQCARLERSALHTVYRSLGLEPRSVLNK